MQKLAENGLLGQALAEVLVCPGCKGELAVEDESILCRYCKRRYPIVDGIPVFITAGHVQQESERIFRDNLKYDSFLKTEEEIVQEAGKHHSIEVMRRRAGSFISRFKPADWVLDIGVGFSWHWNNNNPNNCRILGIDFSITNLKVARRLLADSDKVLLICADAVCLPFKDDSISGIWSVQVFQHFPQIVFAKARNEAGRVLKDKFIMEIVNLNPSRLLKLASLLSGKKFCPHKTMGDMELNRLSAEELKNCWRDLRPGIFIKFSYSELFFHKPCFRSANYPLVLEKMISKIPKVAKSIARQIHLKITSKGEIDE